MIAAVLLLACGGPAPAPTPTPAPGPTPARPTVPALPAPVAPDVAFRMPTDARTTPIALSLDRDLQTARDTLVGVVRKHAMDPQDPWAIVHGMLALGADAKLSNGADPVDWLFAEYAEEHRVGNQDLVRFPATKATPAGVVSIEPHTDLVLKALTEGGVPPSRAVKLHDGRQFQVSALYRDSLQAAWVKGTQTGFVGGWNDTPWALQALASWGPNDLEWTAEGGRKMTLDGFTTAVVDMLEKETEALRQAQASESVPKKDGRGIYRYTCGGAHLFMGATYAVARGFGRDGDQARMCVARDVWRYRIDVELGSLDPLLATPDLDKPTRTLLLTQRLKFLGHWLEATAKLFALGVCAPTDADRAATQRVAKELVATVDALTQLGAFEAMDTMRTDPAWRAVPQRGDRSGQEQLYLDLVGDSSHAVRGIDLAVGAATIAM